MYLKLQYLIPTNMFSKRNKRIHVKGFNMTPNEDEAKAMIEHISFDCKWKFNSTTCNSNQKWNNKTCQCECKNYHKCKNDYSWIPSTCICKNSKYLKSVANTSVTECDGIVIGIDNVPTKKTNTVAINAMNTASINCHSKKVREWFYIQFYLRSYYYW